MSKKYNVAVVGATGLVGQTFLKVLKERKFPVENLYLYASARSAGKVINWEGKDYTVIELKDENIKEVKIQSVLSTPDFQQEEEFLKNLHLNLEIKVL